MSRGFWVNARLKGCERDEGRERELAESIDAAAMFDWERRECVCVFGLVKVDYVSRGLSEKVDLVAERLIFFVSFDDFD